MTPLEPNIKQCNDLNELYNNMSIEEINPLVKIVTVFSLEFDSRAQIYKYYILSSPHDVPHG